MKFTAQLAAVTALLCLIIVCLLHPQVGLLPTHPMATLGLLLIGLGLLRNARQSADTADRSEHC